MTTPKRKTRARSPKRKPRQTARAAHDADLDAEVHHLVDHLAPTIEQLRAAQEEARAQGIFPGDRELLMCPKCGLTEDVLANGQLVTSHGADEPDTGLRFIEPKSLDEPFLCPECDGEAREVPVWIDEEPEPPWEGATSLRVERANVDAARVERLCAALRASERVRPSVRKNSNDELLFHYGLAAGDLLTNLGVLLVGRVRDRARLGAVCSVLAIKYDELGLPVARWAWDDHQRSPLELPDAIWNDIYVFREGYEVPDGMVRTTVPAFDEGVVRELLVNALVHRSYAHPKEIVLHLHPDRLELVSPGRLPPRVTPGNILHASSSRNEALARVFHDAKLMEKCGSGIDLLFERLLATGRGIPTFIEESDSVRVIVPRRVEYPAVRHLVEQVDRRHQLTRHERLVLALVTHAREISATALAARLRLPERGMLCSWLGRLVELGVVERAGHSAKTTRYLLAPTLLGDLGLGYTARTGLK